LEDLGVDERITLKRIFKETGCDDVDWIEVTQDRDQ
jgi:hypothetical protein